MKKAVVFFVFFLFCISLYAKNLQLWGFASQVGNMPLQPFSDMKTLVYPDDPNDDALYFNNETWYFEDDLDDTTTLLTSDTSNNQLIIDSSESIAPDELVILYKIGNISYFYISDANVAQALRTGQQPGNYGGGGYGGNTSTSSSGSNYQTMYNNWERRAQSAYQSLAGHSGSSSTYTTNKKLLREAQNEMREIRRKASRAGVTIPKSQWEDASVGVR